jgi:hypothetical protein
VGEAVDLYRLLDGAAVMLALGMMIDEKLSANDDA